MSLVLVYYAACAVLSFVLGLMYVALWRPHFDIHMTLLFLLIPIVNMCFFLMYENHDIIVGNALMLIIYLGGCFFPWLTTMCIANLCKIHLPRWLRTGTFTISMITYGCVLTIGRLPLYYKSIEFLQNGQNWVLHKEYGPAHLLHYVCLIAYLLFDIGFISYSYVKQRQVSRRIILQLFLPVLFTMIVYCVNHYVYTTGYELLPLSYVADLIVYLFIAHRMVLYNVSDTVVESLVERGETGFITFDFKCHYLGSNLTAVRQFPEIRDLIVDAPISDSPHMKQSVKWIQDFAEDQTKNKVTFQADDKSYVIHIDYLYDGHMRHGYQFFITDDTKNQQYISLLNSFNEQLQQEVEEKTSHIQQMHDRLVLGMAAMVESRDSSTGGHIRRTSEGVRILIETMRKAGANLSDSFCRNVIKAAPMHDLGKIAVDDAILRKPGRFTPQEYEAMKIHPVEGAKIVAEILEGTDDTEFRAIAINVAHYHHERWDGNGYPNHLKQEEIPLESRIMAIADVYDALASKRVYKEKMSFEQADRIIKEGMGTQFDPGLKQYYEMARPALEAYYATID